MNLSDNKPASIPPDMILISRVEFEEIVAGNARNRKAINEFEAKLLSLQHQVEQYSRMIFGSRSERFIPIDKSQINLELEGVDNP